MDTDIFNILDSVHLYNQLLISSVPLSIPLFRDIMSIYKEPPPGMFVVPDPQDMTKVKCQVPSDKAFSSMSTIVNNYTFHTSCILIKSKSKTNLKLTRDQIDLR